MAYTPTEWETGDVITAEKLNKAEQGIADACAYIIPLTYEEQVPTLGASYNDIMAHKGTLVIAQEDFSDDPTDPAINNYYLTACYVDSGKYYATFIGFEAGASTVNALSFEALTADAPLKTDLV